MCNNNENNSCSCFYDTLSTIVKIQKQGQCIDSVQSTCDRPFLGFTPTSAYNTRPITFYTCGNNTLWSMPYTLNDVEGVSSVFRCEAVEGCCATCRVLAENPDADATLPYVATDSFFTINLKCIGCLRCLPDTYISCI